MLKLLQLGQCILLSVLSLSLTSSQIMQAVANTPSIPPITYTPPLESLGQGARLPTPDELQQEKQFDQQQIAKAGEWLKSQDAHQRIVGAEQLNAYQYPAAEQLLLETLQADVEPTVRLAAAQSLGLFKVLSDQGIDKLMLALQDPDDATAKAALETLLGYGTRINMDKQRFPTLLAKLEQQIKAKPLRQELKVAVQYFLNDQKPVCNPFVTRCP